MKKWNFSVVFLIFLFFLTTLFLARRVFAANCITGCVPLIDMTSGQTYNGEVGGLYGNNSNNPPSAHATKLTEAKNSITPINGKIVLLTLGMSNTRMKSDAFIAEVEKATGISGNIVVVNGARGSITAEKWANGENWDYVDNKLAGAGVSPDQVRVIWMEHANFAPQDGLGGCSACLSAGGGYVNTLAGHLRTIINEIKKPNRYPNTEIIFMSPRTYGGYAKVDLNDEPYAYENAFAVRKVILDQINGTNSMVGYATAPVLAWGPYLWASDGQPNIQGLSWSASDFTTFDGTHPVEGVEDKGADKVGEILLAFFKTNIYTASWFTGSTPPPTATIGPSQTATPPLGTATSTPTDRIPPGTNTPTPPFGKPGDANGDGNVDGLDYVIWIINYGKTLSGGAINGDFNNDTQVDGLDYVIWLNNYGK